VGAKMKNTKIGIKTARLFRDIAHNHVDEELRENVKLGRLRVCKVYAYTSLRCRSQVGCPSVRPEASPLPTCQILETDRSPHRDVR
jgi:hypothetical protein